MNLEAPISSIMTTEVNCVTPDQKIIDLKHIYESLEFHSHVPVVDENNKIIGIVSLINFMRAIHNASLDDTEEVYHKVLVKDIMTSRPRTVVPEATIRDVAAILSEGNFHSIPIVENGDVKGIVTTTDLIKEVLK